MHAGYISLLDILCINIRPLQVFSSHIHTTEWVQYSANTMKLPILTAGDGQVLSYMPVCREIISII